VLAQFGEESRRGKDGKEVRGREEQRGGKCGIRWGQIGKNRRGAPGKG